jgi:uncharacterized membrane-anchored protein YjiN (DUF445 family)
MFSWIKKKILKSIIKDITKSLPQLKDKGLILIEEHKDEVIEKVKEAITKTIKDFIKGFDNKKN